jgi:MEMO1 family protein
VLESEVMESEQPFPRLRPVEAERVGDRVVLRDPTGLAQGALVTREAELVLLSLLDGTNSLGEIQTAFSTWSGQALAAAQLEVLLDQLDSTGYLEGPAFEAYYAGLLDGYRRNSVRPMGSAGACGAPLDQLPEYLDAALSRAPASGAPPAAGPLLGLVAPHLDFPRGLPCYAAAYRALAGALRGPHGRGPAPTRVVVLATNHWGRSQSVVTTEADFATPWGNVTTDRPFLRRLQDRCGGDLMPYELDHANEHSVELQVVWLRHVLGDDFCIVPALCPDPSGPRGTSAGDPNGVDLHRFSRALAELAADDPEPTLFVASADLSHVGGYFGDDRSLDGGFLAEVREADEAGLRWLEAGDPEAYRRHMSTTGNPTRVCSVGCLYTILAVLEGRARPRRLEYHQAVTSAAENCVSSAAYALY